MEPLVTIIMSNYNQAKTIRKAIESIFAQKVNFAWQLIITDDNSIKDNSKEIIKEYEEKYPDKVKALYSSENGGYLKNVLRAKRITKTEYFCLLDADDYWTDENYMQKAVDFLNHNPDFTVYCQNVLCVLENGDSYPYGASRFKTSDYSIEDYLTKDVFIPQTTGSFFRNVIFKNGIPKLMEESKDTTSNLSYEGDHARFLMHLKYGKAHYSDDIAGVYNITSGGIWTSLPLIDKYFRMMLFMFDMNKFYEYKYEKEFIKKSCDYYRDILCFLDPLNPEFKKYEFSKVGKEVFEYAMSYYSEKVELIKEAFKKPEKKVAPKKISFKNKIRLKIYNHLKKKLKKKGLI